MRKKYLISIIIVAIIITLFAVWRSKVSKSNVDLSLLQTKLTAFSVPEDTLVVGLGEASHGVKEYQQMKEEVFKALVQNNGSQTFIIEGDFGGALKVNAYIHGGGGTAEEVVGEIGFPIYRTKELVDLVDWMRSYNESAPEGEDLYFYGMDIQRFDNNKEFLFSVLDEAIPTISKKYKRTLSELTDEKRIHLSTDILNKAKEEVLGLLKEMDAYEKDIVGISGQTAFDYARESANSIYECSEVLLSNNTDYNTIRDKYMFEKVNWFLNHGDGSVLFINGHNGHIGKTSTSGYVSLGDLLKEDLGEKYYAIGTDAKETEFNSQDSNGKFSISSVTNQNALNRLLDSMESNYYFIDFKKVMEDDNWQKLLKRQQKITTLNVGISSWQRILKFFYTSKIIPNDTFDAMIVFKKVFPTTLIE